MNLMPATLARRTLSVHGYDMPYARDLGDGGVILGVRPGALRLPAEGMAARGYLVEYLGDSTIVNFQIGDLILRMRTDRSPDLRHDKLALPNRATQPVRDQRRSPN
jgi:hypothetical protein